MTFLPARSPASALRIRGPGLGALILLGVLMPLSVLAQAPVHGSLQGRVLDEEGAPVPGVLVRAVRIQAESLVRGAETDDLGYFHLESLDPGSYRLEASRLGFESRERVVEVEAGSRRVLEIVLPTRAVVLEGINVEAERSRERMRFEEEAGATVRELAGRQIKSIPGLVEADPLRAVEVLPGVITTSDFSSAYNVRGGSADQNLILLDGMPVFNPTHLGGFFSVFNSDMVERAELQSGGFPARFGGRVSSVLDVQTDPGDGRVRGDAGLSLLATRLALGGGLPEGWRRKVGLRTVQWRVSGRRSYFDQVLRPVFDFPYHLRDVQGIVQGWTQGGNRVSVSAYSGRDVLNLANLDDEDFPLRVSWDWGNDVVGARFTHPRPNGGRWEVRTGFSRFGSGLGFPDFDDTEISSSIQQATMEADLEIHPSPELVLSTGGGLRRLTSDNLFSTGGTDFGGTEGEGTEVFAYLQGEWRAFGRWLLEAGVRGEMWSPSGGSRRVEVSPRVSLKRFLAGTRWALKGSVGRYTQYLQSIRNEELPLGLDVWVLSDQTVPPVISNQAQLGLEGYPREGWYASVEAYYRDFDGVVTTNFADNPNDDADDYLAGNGESYGVDVYIRRSRGATTGWLTLSWLRASRTFPDYRSGLDPAPRVRYPPTFDRRLDLDLVLRRELGGGLVGGLRWNFGTGLPYTRPVASYTYLSPRLLPGAGLEWERDEEDVDEENGGGYGVVLSDRNGKRYPARHRLDVSLRWKLDRGWGSLTPYLSVLNVYNQKNVLFYFFEYEKDPPVRTGISMFPLLPTLGLEVSF